MRGAVLLVVALAQAAGQSQPFVRTLFVEYRDGDAQGHFELGLAIGRAMGAVVRQAWEGDEELRAMEQWTASGEGQRIFDNLVGTSNRSFPLYTREVEGMAEGAQIPLRRMLVNQLREELAQWLSREDPRRPRVGHCTDAYAVDPYAGVTALGHNDDWDVYWRNATYVVVATALDAKGGVKFRFGTWVYPGYLLGEQLNWNSYGLLWTCNSLFPQRFLDDGVGTAWVARHMVEAKSLEDLIDRAADKRVTTAMNYNVGTLQRKVLWNLEVDAGGVNAIEQITGPYLHTNEFKLLNSPQFPEDSSDHRQHRWDALRPNTVPGVRAFLSDRADPHWPVWRNRTGGDDCYTQVTGLFDLERRTLSVWTVPAASAAPELELALDFPPPPAEVLYT
mmetsp:Transcript_57996/g.155307  ORF Transcript_57996/g.155307 Transcript_57996/m.155307 type:complete len:391 (-) Transcript_57996:114-1286(-)